MIPGSAIRKLVAITGCGVGTDGDGGFYFLFVDSATIFKSFLKDEKAACQDLRNQNWARVSKIVFEKQDWKCARCGQCRPLQAHHRIYRSRWRRSDGPLDVESNIEGLCEKDHGAEHRG